MKVLGLINARGGSKGIPNKNVKEIAGKPLIAWTIEAAAQSNKFEDIVVSTDDVDIATVAKVYGASVPFMRSAQLAADETPGIDPVLDALERLPGFDAIMLMQPTSPLRNSADIVACINYAESKNVNSIVSVCESHYHPNWMFSITYDNVLKSYGEEKISSRRQDLKALYSINGAMYFGLVDWLRDQRSFIDDHTHAYIMPPERSIDIDTPLDWKFAELLLGESLL